MSVSSFLTFPLLNWRFKFRNQLQKLWESFWKASDFPENPSKSLGSLRLLLPFTLQPAQVKKCTSIGTFHHSPFIVLDEIKSEDAVYVLAYSVIMLNTDLHNPQVRVYHHTSEPSQSSRLNVYYSRNVWPSKITREICEASMTVSTFRPNSWWVWDARQQGGPIWLFLSSAKYLRFYSKTRNRHARRTHRTIGLWIRMERTFGSFTANWYVTKSLLLLMTSRS